MRKTIHYALLLAATGIAFALALLLPSDQARIAAMAAGVLVILTGTTAVLGWPRGVIFINQHKRNLVVIGWIICVAGIVFGPSIQLFIAFQSPVTNSHSDSAAIYVGLTVSLLGYMASRLPRMANQVEQSRAELAALKRTDQSPTGFMGAREGLDASFTVLRDWSPFLQIAAPWVLCLCVPVYWMVLSTNTLGHDPIKAELVLLAILLLLILFCLSIPTVVVAWTRWIIRGQRPPTVLALPNRATLSLLWRVWIFGSVLGTVDRFVTGEGAQIATSLHLSYAATVGNIAGWVVDILAVMLASSFALRLPALAVGDTAFTQSTALIQGRRMWPGLPIGLVLSLAPFFVVGWIVNGLYDTVEPAAPAGHHTQARVDLLSAGLMAMGLLAVFAAFASAATFLSRAYNAAKERSALGMESV